MTVGILFLAALVLIALQRVWAPKALSRLHFHGECDRIMAEPGEIITWIPAVENTRRLPIPFVRLRESFPYEAKIEENSRWMAAHCQKGIQQWFVEEKLSLAPRQRCKKPVRFSISKRGMYHIGRYRLCAGDLLGFHERGIEGDGGNVVIIPHRAHDQKALQAVSGFLGDISVRRYILEDPILTVGFRDYTGREPMKAISWTRSAATGVLQVKQYDHTAEQSVVILLDTEDGTPEELEGCFRLMRTVCEQLEQNKIPYGLRTNGKLPGTVGNLFQLPSGLGRRHLDTVLYALGRADYTCYHSFRYMTQQTLRHRKNNESYIVITPHLAQRNRHSIQQLEAAAGSGVCVLTGRSEVDAI